MDITPYKMKLLKKIAEDEAWYEGERRGVFVSTEDEVVKQRVQIIADQESSALTRAALKDFSNQARRTSLLVSEMLQDNTRPENSKLS